MVRTLPVGRIEPSPTTGILAVGDVAMIALFVAAGEATHAGTLAAGIETFAQFGLGWLVAAPLLGAYARGAVSSSRRAAGVALLSWVAAALLGQAIRAVSEAGARPAPAFVLVSIGVGGVLIVAWRVVAARFLGS